jgi:hypothetical protein
MEHAHHGAPPLLPLLMSLGAPTPPLRWEHAGRWVSVSWVGVVKKKKVIDRVATPNFGRWGFAKGPLKTKERTLS